MSLGNERRPDQLRDKDTIQRECLKAYIEGDDVQIGIYREFGGIRKLQDPKCRSFWKQ